MLLMVVLMTIGLSLTARTTEELFLAQQEAESARVFHAAESGIESALTLDFEDIDGTEAGTIEDIFESLSVGYTVTATNELDTFIRLGEVAAVDLQGATGALNLSWARDGTTTCPSLVASIYSEEGGVTQVRHVAFGPPDSGACPDRDDQFVEAVPGSDGYRYSYSLDFDSDDDLFVRLRMVYDDAHVRVSGTNLPTQAHVIRATAQSEIGDEATNIQVYRTHDTAPGFMDYALYSGGGIIREE